MSICFGFLVLLDRASGASPHANQSKWVHILRWQCSSLDRLLDSLVFFADLFVGSFRTFFGHSSSRAALEQSRTGSFSSLRRVVAFIGTFYAGGLLKIVLLVVLIVKLFLLLVLLRTAFLLLACTLLWSQIETFLRQLGSQPTGSFAIGSCIQVDVSVLLVWVHPHLVLHLIILHHLLLVLWRVALTVSAPPWAHKVTLSPGWLVAYLARHIGSLLLSSTRAWEWQLTVTSFDALETFGSLLPDGVLGNFGLWLHHWIVGTWTHIGIISLLDLCQVGTSLGVVQVSHWVFLEWIEALRIESVIHDGLILRWCNSVWWDTGNGVGFLDLEFWWRIFTQSLLI